MASVLCYGDPFYPHPGEEGGSTVCPCHLWQPHSFQNASLDVWVKGHVGVGRDITVPVDSPKTGLLITGEVRDLGGRGLAIHSDSSYLCSTGDLRLALGSEQQVGQGQEGRVAPALPQATPSMVPEPTLLSNLFRHQRVLGEQRRLRPLLPKHCGQL